MGWLLGGWERRQGGCRLMLKAQESFIEGNDLPQGSAVRGEAGKLHDCICVWRWVRRPSHASKWDKKKAWTKAMSHPVGEEKLVGLGESWECKVSKAWETCYRWSEGLVRAWSWLTFCRTGGCWHGSPRRELTARAIPSDERCWTCHSKCSKHLMHINWFIPSKSPSKGFPGGSVVKKLPANAGDMGSIPGLDTT